ncbi:MAG TPA: SMR family transporter [Polyangiales bacterium]
MRGAPLSAWLLLLGAIIGELVGTAALKYASGGRTVAWIGVVLGYGAALWLLNSVIAQIDVGVVYALWSGIGIALVATTGVVLFGEPLTLTRALGLLAIAIGIALLQLSGEKNF